MIACVHTHTHAHIHTYIHKCTNTYFYIYKKKSAKNRDLHEQLIPMRHTQTKILE